MKQLIGKSSMNNSLLMILELYLRTGSPHPCRMIWRIIKNTIVPWPMNIGVNSCPQYRTNKI